MARRPAKTHLPEVRFASVLKAFLCCLLIGGVAVGYVRQTHENTALKEKRQELSEEINEREEENVALRKELNDLQSNEALEDLGRHLGVDLQPPRPGQVVELNLADTPRPLMARSSDRLGRAEGGRE